MDMLWPGGQSRHLDLSAQFPNRTRTESFGGPESRNAAGELIVSRKPPAVSFEPTPGQSVRLC